MYTGIILMLISRFIPQKYRTMSFGIGLGLFIDELIHLFHILGLTTASDYWSFKSVMTTIMGIHIVLAFGFVHQRKLVQST